MPKSKTSFTLTPECLALLKAIAIKKGISMAAAIELMTREEAKKEKIQVS